MSFYNNNNDKRRIYIQSLESMALPQVSYYKSLVGIYFSVMYKLYNYTLIIYINLYNLYMYNFYI